MPGSYLSSVGGAGAVLPGNGAYGGGQQMGDIVGNLRIDQTWGGAQVMGAVPDEATPTTYRDDPRERPS